MTVKEMTERYTERFMKVTSISFGAAFFVPFSDAVMSHCVNPKSFLGPFLVHHLKSVVGAGLGGVATAFVAERVYGYVEMKFFSIAYKKQESFVSNAVLFSTRFVVYASVGGALGLAAGLFVPTVTVATGVAVGVASFVGSQLVSRLIGKIMRIVLEDIFGVCSDVSNTFERSLYAFMGLSDAALCSSLSHKHHDYDRRIREAVKSRIKEIKPDSMDYFKSLLNSFISEDIFLNEHEFIALCLKNKLYKKNEKELDRIADLLVESVERIAKCMVNYCDKHEYECPSNQQAYSFFLEFIPSLCMTVAWAVIDNKASLIEKYEYNGKYQNRLKNGLLKRKKDENFEPVFFDITKEQGEIINKVYDKVRPFLKAKKSDSKHVLKRTSSLTDLKGHILLTN